MISAPGRGRAGNAKAESPRLPVGNRGGTECLVRMCGSGRWGIFICPHTPEMWWVVGALPPAPQNVDLKVSEMSAIGPPRGCASGSLWVNIGKKGFKNVFFIKNEGFIKLRKN